MGHMMKDTGHPGYTGNLNRKSMTIAEVLRENGYNVEEVMITDLSRYNRN